MELWLLLLLLLSAPGFAQTDPDTVQVSSRRDVILPCEAPKGTDVDDIALEWTRPELDEYYVFFFRNRRPDLAYQHVSFRDRAELVSSSLQDGNLSLRLKDVSSSDSGLYECHIFSQSQYRKRSVFDTEPIRVIDLKVLQPEPQRILAVPGENVVLPFSPRDESVMGLMWKKAGLEQDTFVFLFGMGHPHHQHPKYRGRVELLNQDKTGGDLSVVLKDVQPEDGGLYYGHIVQSQRRKRDLHESEPFMTVDLVVKSAAPGLKPAVVVAVAALITSVFLLFGE